MMRLTPRHLRQNLPTPQRRINLITLPLRTRILPIRTKWVRKRVAQLLLQRLLRIQPLEHMLRLQPPIHAPMLLPSPTDTPHAREIQTLIAEAVKDAVQGLQPEGDGGEDFVLGFVGLHAFLDGEVVGVGVEVEDGRVDDFEVGVDHQAWFVSFLFRAGSGVCYL